MHAANALLVNMAVGGFGFAAGATLVWLFSLGLIELAREVGYKRGRAAGRREGARALRQMIESSQRV
jgi:hypothetical protein